MPDQVPGPDSQSCECGHDIGRHAEDSPHWCAECGCPFFRDPRQVVREAAAK